MEFEPIGRRKVTGALDGGRMTSDSGAMLLREAGMVFGVTRRLAACFTGHRSPLRTGHPVAGLAAQRVIALAPGCEDINDHDRLRDDPALALAAGCGDITGQSRVRERGRGLAASDTLSRMEPGAPGKIGRLLAPLFLETHTEPPEETVLDLDATDDPPHGRREGRFCHGRHGCHCCLPLYIFCGDRMLCGRLRTSGRDAADGALDEIRRIVPQLRESWPPACPGRGSAPRLSMRICTAPAETWKTESKSSRCGSSPPEHAPAGGTRTVLAVQGRNRPYSQSW